MNKVYNHKLVEENKNKKWIKNRYFSTHKLSKKAFSIILPPPNITGKLHIGHAWNTTLQDFLIRFKKIQGYDVLWLPGMDHAGIATQSKVEERLKHQGIDKNLFSKKELFKKAMEWKEEYANEIKRQWYKLGLAFDYENERFTLDKLSNKAVSDVFIKLYNEGLIYRGKRAIYYDTFLQTALSNIEVINKESDSKMYYLKYYLENSTSKYILVATTRPETLASDVALIINPEDKKNQKYLNKNFINPLTKNILKMYQDNYAIPNFGSGIVKISAHDINDFNIIEKLNLEIKESIDKFGKMNHLTSDFEGLDRFKARDEIIKKLTREDLVEKIENIKSNISISERSNTIVEVLVMPQWFLKMDFFNNLVLDKINQLNSENKVKFYPNRFENILKIWMENAYDWNISRQLWWGHKIPAWYDKKGNIKIQKNSPGKNWNQDEDVLDTWFSSGLASFSFLNWPLKNNKLLKRYYPTSVLVTAYDIIFFWIARMYFMGIHITKQIPFKKTLIHGLIRDSEGRKMSKSLGNGIDPMDLIDKYGADSLRWFLMTNSTPGKDIRFSHEKMKSSWSLINKIWNISRYILMLKDNLRESKEAKYANGWILNKFTILKKIIELKTESFEFSILGKEIYKFIIEDFSSWYIELTKNNYNKIFMVNIWSNFLLLIHPFMPFITDHLFFELNNKELLESKFLKLTSVRNFHIIDDVIEIVKKIREYRTEFNLSHKKVIGYNLNFINLNKNVLIRVLIEKMANVTYSEKATLFFKLSRVELKIKIPDEAIEKKLLLNKKRKAILETEIKRSNKILLNSKFLEKAPKEKIKQEKEKLRKYKLEYLNLNKHK